MTDSLEHALLRDILAHQTNNAQTLGEIKQAVESLAGPEGRVTRIERDLSWQSRKQWIHSAIIVPVAAALLQGVKYLLPQ